ncbi:MAG TPA: NUMOD3 domain-containing DNA-binding protein [Puia sp.]|jgi:hypothetical protein|nr:NUMOD3 domain-containing DNA-binding protein [Puia sp.]
MWSAIKGYQTVDPISGQPVFLIEYDKTEFKPIPGHRQYVINCDGSIVKRIMSEKLLRKSELKQSFHKDKGKEYPHGYWYVTLLTKDGINSHHEVIDLSDKLTLISIHRLVAKTWCINPDPINNIWVNHEDGNKINNHFSNLKWGSISYNIQHAHDTGLSKVPSGSDHWNYGKTLSKETKSLQSIAKLGAKHPKFKGWYVVNGVEYESSYLAAKAIGTYPKWVWVHCIQQPLQANYFKYIDGSNNLR